MAYQADILINVKGFQDLGRIQKALEGTAQKIDAVNRAAAEMGAPVRNIDRFTRQLQQAERALENVAIGSVQEQRAISNYVTALNNSNVARDRQNKLIQSEVAARNSSTNAIRANVEANIAESRASRAAREEAAALNKELVQQERLRRKLAERGLMQLSGGGVAKGVSDAGFGVQGPARPPAAGGMQGFLQKPGIADAIIGAGFPALFGGGPGAILGGGAGGLIGGAMGGTMGMALSIGLSAVGQKIDEAVQKVKQLGDALNLLSVDKLRDTFIVVNAELETTVRRLLEAGNAEAARAAMATEVAAQTGALGTAIQDSGNATNMLSSTWNEFSGAVASLLSMLAAPFAAALAGILKILGMAVRGVNVIVSLVGGALKNGVASVIGLLPGGKQLLQSIETAVRGTNEEQEKLKAALVETTDAAHRQLLTSMKLEQIDKQRTHVVTTLGKLINNEADRQAKVVQIRANAENKIIELRLKYGKLTDAQSKKELEIAIGQVKAQAALETREANRVALRQRLVILNQQLVEQDKLAIQIAANQAQVENTRLQVNTQILNQQVQELQQRRQFALSLNEESALIDAIAKKKIDAANTTYNAVAKEQQAKIQTLTAELALVEAQYKRGFATETQVAQAKDNLNTATAIAEEVLRGAAYTRDQATAAADLERRQEQVSAFAKAAADETERFNRAANESLNALNNNLKVVDAYSQAQLTINNLEIQSLQNKLAQATTDGERYDILDSIRVLEIKNAGITLQATRAQIAAEVERQRIALAMAEVKYKELEAVVRLAAAQKALTQDHIRALEAQRSALQIARDNYSTSQAVANEQYRAADAVYNAAVNAANLKMNLEGSAAAAGAIAGSMERAANASASAASGYLTASNIKNPLLRAEAEGRIAAIDRNTPRTGNVLASLRALDQKQQIVLDYMALEKKAAQEQQMQSAAQELRSLGLSRYIPMQYKTQEDTPALFQRYGSSASSSGGSVNPQVSITTGPVMRMGDQNYVSQSDLMSATSSAAKQGAALALSKLKDDPATRRSVGILR